MRQTLAAVLASLLALPAEGFAQTSGAPALDASDTLPLGLSVREGIDSLPVESDRGADVTSGVLAELTMPGQATRSSVVFDRVAVHRRISARTLLQGQDVTHAFSALRPLLRPGVEVVVTDEHGRARRGQVVALDDTTLTVGHPASAGKWEAALPLLPPFWWPLADFGVALKRSLSPSPDQRFAQEAVNRIDVVDPTRNGTLIGAAVGVGLATAAYLSEGPGSDHIGTIIMAFWGIPISMRIGHVLDRAINEPIYTRQPNHRPFSISPRIEPRVKAVVIRLTL